MIDFDAEGNLIRKLTSTASETDAAAAANDLLERLHHKKTEPTASELEQLAREAAGKVNRFYFDKTQKEVPYEIILSVCQQVQELARKDTGRLDWLEAHYEVLTTGNLVLRKDVANFSPFKQNKVSIRQAIDNATTAKEGK